MLDNIKTCLTCTSTLKQILLNNFSTFTQKIECTSAAMFEKLIHKVLVLYLLNNSHTMLECTTCSELFTVLVLSGNTSISHNFNMLQAIPTKLNLDTITMTTSHLCHMTFRGQKVTQGSQRSKV